MNLSLINIMRDDEFGKRIIKKVQEIKSDRENLNSAAKKYSEKYQEEILEGTQKRANLLTEGKSRGLSDDEVAMEYGRFIPTIYTPLLNLLYFMLRESDNDPRYGNQRYQERNKLDEQFGLLREDDIEKTILKDTPDLEEFLYGSVTLDQFDVLKKLKALSVNNNNIEEATLAFRKGLELCKKYDLNWEKIPCYVRKT